MSGVYLLLNDSDPLILYDGAWIVESSNHGNSHCLEGDEDGRISVAFNGTSIAFAGSAPNAPFQVSINGEIQDAPNPDENHYGRWYQSPELKDGLHVVNLSGLARGTELNYVLIEAGLSTSLANSSIAVDDSSTKDIWYSPGWNDESPDNLSYSPFNGSTTASMTEADMFSFKFAGTAVHVYGIHESGEGTAAVTFTIDDSTSSFVASEEGDTTNYLYFTKDGLDPGPHTLVCNVTKVTGDRSFVLDYIVYTPSFDSISDQPDLHPEPQASTFPTGSSRHSKPKHPNSGIPAGAIAGLVAGVVIFSVIVVTLIAIWSRGRKQRGVALSRSSSFGDATVASGGLSPPESSIDSTEVRTPLVPNRFDPNLFVSNNVRSEKHPSSSRQLSFSSRFGIGWGYSKRTSSYPEKF